jgi:hypothetical protein
MHASIHRPKIGVVVIVLAFACHECFDFKECFSSRCGPTVINLLRSCWEVECMDVWDNIMRCLSRISLSLQSQKCKFVRCPSVKVWAQKGCTLIPCTCDIFFPHTQSHKCVFVGCQSVTNKIISAFLNPGSCLFPLHLDFGKW